MPGHSHDASHRPQPLPTLTIGAVVAEIRRTFPDVTHSSLRFLEREGLIAAARTAGGHRLYTDNDVDRIRQVKQWQQQRLSLQEIHQRLTHLDRLPPTTQLADEFLQLAASGNLTGARQTILDAANAGIPLQRLFSDLLAPALFEAGRRWEDGELMVAQEKEISEVARELITELTLRHAATHAPAPVLIAACVEGEDHELGLRMMCGLLRARGFAVHFLGADVAPRFLLESVRFHRPAGILLSATLAPRLPAVSQAIDTLVTGIDPAAVSPIFVGGQIAADEQETIRAWGAIPVSDRLLDDALATILPLLPVPNDDAQATR